MGPQTEVAGTTVEKRTIEDLAGSLPPQWRTAFIGLWGHGEEVQLDAQGAMFFRHLKNHDAIKVPDANGLLTGRYTCRCDEIFDQALKIRGQELDEAIAPLRDKLKAMAETSSKKLQDRNSREE